MVNAKKQQGQGGGERAGKIIDFTFWIVLVPVGSEKDGVIDTSVSCEDARWMMDRCHRQCNKQSCLILSPYYVVVAGRGANCTSLVLESFPASSACIFCLPSFYNQCMYVFNYKHHPSYFILYKQISVRGHPSHQNLHLLCAVQSFYIYSSFFFPVFFFPSSFYLHSW